MSATSDIQNKWQALKNSGLDLGAKSGAEQDAGYGGKIQQYSNGRIYWHHTVGCFEVHGGILSTYLAAGGHDINPANGIRELGFPKTDESVTEDGYRAVSYFEWGAVYWCYGGVRVFGEIYKKYQETGEVTGTLGYPVCEPVKVGQLQIAYFELGCICLAPFLTKPLVIHYNFPLMGNPMITHSTNQNAIAGQVIFTATLSAIQKTSIESSGLDIVALVAGSLFKLQSTPKPGRALQAVPLLATGSIQPASTFLGSQLFRLKGMVTLKPDSTLTDRTLYDIAIQTPRGATYVLSPHCVYVKKDTATFGLMHSTDLHVSRRIDSFRSILHQKGLQEGVNEMVNWNDKMRDLVKYANHLHEIGSLDLILATGDLVDYVFEKSDNRKGGGNFQLFREIILGKSPYGNKDFYAPNKDLIQEELLVPIFTTLGNHDYRPNHYELYADIDAGDNGTIDWAPGGLGDQDISSYSGLNITATEVKALQNGSKYRVNMNAAANSLSANNNAQHFYRRYINGANNYVVNMGLNKIVVIDSKWDLGILDAGVKDILKVISGFTSETEKDLMEVNPDQTGFDDAAVTLLRNTLSGAGTEGVVIMGVHGPIVNPKGNEYPHYFRQTEHPTVDKELMNAYLIRQNSTQFSLNGGLINRDRPFQDWIRTGSLNFKKQDPSNMLDYGTCRGKVSEIIRLCLGQEVPRPVDLVLCGHGHKNVEYRFGWKSEEKFFRFYTDFYSENPGEYYQSVYNDSYNIFQNIISVKDKKNVRVFVNDNAVANTAPAKTTDHRPDIYWKEYWSVNVLSYANPLNKTSAAKAWWQQHRPLMMQTGATGPVGNLRKDPSVNKTFPNPNFSGIRMLSIENNVISKCRYLLMDEIRKSNFKMPWEPAAPTRPGRHHLDIDIKEITSVLR